MQFIKNGPDIPERLLQAHEEGHVAFFCGAGISYPAGLPGFDGLAKRLYERLGIAPNPVQDAALKAKRYDSAIGLLEANIVGGRATVRHELAEILTPSNTSEKALATHKALLSLSRCRSGRIHLITTNFDRLFELVHDRKPAENIYQAPLLPLPKNRWDGLVYLHGLLSTEPSDSELDNLVVSSGDFGLAYLTERWAARFVSELFRNYTVCFVGYSIDDPVLRYMMDALAADRQRGESPMEMYAFGGYAKGTEAAIASDWRAKNVTPILYWEVDKHRYLHETLRSWSEAYRDGAQGKEMIVVKEAIANPLSKTGDDDFVGRVLWALSDPSGLPARRFSELHPAPSLDWLDALSEEKYHFQDLGRFGVLPKKDEDPKLAFSLLRRPAPYDHTTRMSLFSEDSFFNKWDDVMPHLANWLIRYLDDPALILWLAKHGGRPHDQFASLIERQIDYISELEAAGKIEKLDELRATSPRGLPRPILRILWGLLLSGRIAGPMPGLGLYAYREKLKKRPISSDLRMTIREALAPCTELREPYPWNAEATKGKNPERITDVVEWDIRLHAEDAVSFFRDLSTSATWQASLPSLLPDLNILLKDALDLMRELGGADDKSDLSYMHHPSISEHEQNTDYREWTILIDLVRDAWLGLAKFSPEQAMLVARQWQQTPYPLFKRLAFYAATQESIIPPELAIEWILEDSAWWLWSIETRRETLRLITAHFGKLESNRKTELEEAILAGPPRAMFKADLEADDWIDLIDREIWLRLAKLEITGSELGERAKNALDSLSAQYPEWEIAADERDEFPFWTSSGWSGEEDRFGKIKATPRKRRALVQWLKEQPSTAFPQEDDWRQRCRDDFSTTACALFALSRANIWPADRWREALQVWAEEKHLERSWRHMARVIVALPDAVIKSLAHPLAYWLQALAKTFVGQDELFIALCRRILNMEHEDGVDTEEPIIRAINHPIGQVTEALLHWWYRSEPKDNTGLPEMLVPIFTQLCRLQNASNRNARVLFAAHIISLYRVDPGWTRENMLPFFSWQKSQEEARTVWSGFLWSPRIYRPLFELIMTDFIDTAAHYDELGEHGPQYAALLTFAALEPRETFALVKLRAAMAALPEKGREEAARTLVRALESAGEQRTEYWHNKVLPYWKNLWPKSRDAINVGLRKTIAELCIAARDSFPEAFETLRLWLGPVEYPDFVVRSLAEAGLAKSHPKSALAFLDTVIGGNVLMLPRDLSNCLEDFRTADPGLEKDEKYRRLMEQARKYTRG